MVKSKEAFSWKDGVLPVCGIHSQVKLDILRDYILAYFQTVAAKPFIPRIPIYFVDAFAGGGSFKSALTGAPVAGSPFVMLNAVHESEQLIAAHRTKEFCIDATFMFADSDPFAIEQLSRSVVASSYRDKYNSGKVFIDNTAFDQFLPKCLSRIPSRSTTKAIFFLDQCGWNAATIDHCNLILNHLPKAEIIWNISVESMASYATDDERFRKAAHRFGVNLDDAFTDKPNLSHFRDWRKLLLMDFLTQIRAKCRAEYVSPFMIQHDGWGYWLLHLSNHPQANNVMKGMHWKHQNDSLHEGFAGLNMLEFNQQNFNQPSLFRFDTAASQATHEALFTQLMARIHSLGDRITVDTLTKSVANETPADASRLNAVLADLKREGEIRIIGSNGEQRKAGPKRSDDWLVIPPQPKLFLPM